MHPQTRHLAPLFFLLLLALNTLFYGGNFPFSQTLSVAASGGLLIFSAFQVSRTNHPVSDRWLQVGLILPLGLVLAWVLAQLLPFWSNPWWAGAPAAAPWSPLSLNPGATLAQLGLVLAYAAAAISLFRAGATGSAPLILKGTALIITLASFYGLVIYATGNQTVFLLPKVDYTNSLTATFINRNSFATMAGLGMLASLAITLQRVGEISNRLAARQRLRAFWLLVLVPGWPWLCTAAICFLALVLTNSRAGMGASLLGVLVMLGSLAAARKAARWPLLGIGAVMAVGGLLVLIMLGGTLGSRLTSVSESAAARQVIYNYTGEAIAQNALTGSGLGTFASAFQMSRNIAGLSRIGGVVEHAHNTYLELALELGLPAMALLAAAAFTLLALLINGLIVRRRAVIWPALGAGAFALLASHALADFSLSIPAVTLAGLALIMPALAQSLMPLPEEKAAPRPRNLMRYPLLAAGLAVLAFGAWQSAAEYHAYRAEPIVNAAWKGKALKQEVWVDAQHELLACLAINPYHPTCSRNLGQIYIARGTGYGLTGMRRGVGLIYLHMARTQFEESLKRAPADSSAWFRLAQLAAFLDTLPQAVTPLINSVLTGPSEMPLAANRIPLMFKVMPLLPSQDAALFEANIAGLWDVMPYMVWRRINANPAAQLELAKIVKDNPDTLRVWKTLTRTPFPLGEQMQTR